VSAADTAHRFYVTVSNAGRDFDSTVRFYQGFLVYFFLSIVVTVLFMQINLLYYEYRLLLSSITDNPRNNY
jgi:hypothetical protein